jgi:type II secretory pathway pseudopilin PulG
MSLAAQRVTKSRGGWHDGKPRTLPPHLIGLGLRSSPRIRALQTFPGNGYVCRYMRQPSPVARPALPAFARRRIGGFTLFETGLALLALALAAYIALAEVGKFQHRAQRDQFVADLRSLATAFETYRAQKGEWPAATNAEARIPRGMESALANSPWLAGPPFGGTYDWVPPARTSANDKNAPKDRVPAGMIAITAFSPGLPLALSDEDLRYIDRKLDDGNLATGRFLTGFNRWPIYLVSPRP